MKETACNPRGFWRAEQSESIHNYSNSFIRGEYLPLFLNIWIFISAVVAVKIISCSFPLYPFSKLRYTWHRYPPLTIWHIVTFNTYVLYITLRNLIIVIFNTVLNNSWSYERAIYLFEIPEFCFILPSWNTFNQYLRI